MFVCSEFLGDALPSGGVEHLLVGQADRRMHKRDQKSVIRNLTQLLRMIFRKGLNASPTTATTLSLCPTGLGNGAKKPGEPNAGGRTFQSSALADRSSVDVATLAEKAISKPTALQRGAESTPHVLGETDPELNVVRGDSSCGDDPLRLELEAEVSAEEYFRHLRGEAVVGHFVPIGHASFAHEETDWDVGDLQSEVSQLPALKPNEEPSANRLRARKTVSSARSQSPLGVSVDQLYAEVDSRRWLSPKSRSALEKLKRGKANLTRPELNALDYLLSRAKNISRLAPDIERIHVHIADKFDGTR